MKRHSFLLFVLTLFCSGCGEKPQPILEKPVENAVEEPMLSFDVPSCTDYYSEPIDMLYGLASNDLDDFRIALGKVKTAFRTYNECFLNEESNNYYKINYGNKLSDSFFDYYEDIDVFTEENFIFDDTYRLSKTKFEINNQDAVNRILKIVVPELKNEGYFLTFNRATIELNDQKEFYRFRLYVNTTQVGKLIDSHQKQENTNWYLLFGQCYFWDQIKVTTNNN